MKNDIGAMQGRLLPQYQGRYQAHPVGYWQEEFEVAKGIGLDCIEFILDYNDAEKNPLLKANGAEEILAVCERSNVSVKTICADYFMEAPLHAIDESVAIQSMGVLKSLLETASQIGAADIVIPCVDQSTLQGPEAIRRFVAKVRTIIPAIEKIEINLALETDLAPQSFVDLLERLGSKKITVNYDIGNSAALGYDPAEELDAYGARITDIHIKDRVIGDGPVILGEGDADFELFFDKLKAFDYQGPFIMQAYRDDEGVMVFKKQLEWIKPLLNL